MACSFQREREGREDSRFIPVVFPPPPTPKKKRITRKETKDQAWRYEGMCLVSKVDITQIYLLKQFSRLAQDGKRRNEKIEWKKQEG